ncbi:MAG: TIGR01212 family radical SAM protein [Bacteroidales bacterium]|nr:TIGR01212 family radical SAM protein [Bacteroidales bacterium]
MIYPWGDERRFNSYKRFLQERFGTRVQKLTLDAGFTCPNRDGSVGVGGCSYCLNDAFNPSYCTPRKSVQQQLEEGMEFHRNRYRRADGYLAYFQAFSNTYAPLEQLKEIYRPAIENPQVKGIVVGTRPDCIDEAKLDFFAELQQKIFVSVEYGVEACNDTTLRRINRGHDFATAQRTIEQTAQRGIHCAAHFIYGLPGETPDQWLNEVDTINKLPINGIKFHQLQIINGTSMQREFIEKPSDFHIFTQDTYVDFIVSLTERLNPKFVIERFAGEVPPRYLFVNHWGLTRYDIVLQKIENRMAELDTWQGKKLTDNN